MLSFLFRSRPAYPQQQCFFCTTTSVILPPYTGTGTHNASRSPVPVAPASSSSSSNNKPSTSALTISTGTAESWLCSSCQCHNTLRPDGSFQDHWSRPMWDEQYNTHRNQLIKHQSSNLAPSAPRTNQPGAALQPFLASASPSAGMWDKQRHPDHKLDNHTFCHTCQTNQTLQISLLADYLPDESDPEYADKLHALPAYRASIAARYPSVCQQCAPAVQDVIQERDQMARSWTLAQWLASKTSQGTDEDAPSTAAESGPDGRVAASKHAVQRKTGASASSSDRQGRAAPQQLGPRWLYQGACWTLSSLATLACCALAASQPMSVRDSLMVVEYLIHEEPLSSTSIVILGGLALVLKALLIGQDWDPTARRVARARRRGVRPDVQGLEEWKACRNILYTLRLLCICTVVVRLAASSFLDTFPLPSDPDWIIRSFGAAALSAEMVLLFSSFYRLRVRMPPTLRLVSKPLFVASTSQPCGRTLGEGARLDPANEAFSSLSLVEQKPAIRSSAHQSHRTTFSPPSPVNHLTSPCSLSSLHRDKDGDEIMHYSPSYAHTDLSFDEDEPLPFASSTWSSQGRQRRKGVQTEAYDLKLGAQRFWEPQNPTGLEEVFGKAVRLQDDEMEEAQRRQDDEERQREGKSWKWFLGMG